MTGRRSIRAAATARLQIQCASTDRRAGAHTPPAECLRASLLLALAAAPAPAAVLVDEASGASAGPRRRMAAHRALRSLQRDGLVMSAAGPSSGGTYRLSPAGEERLRRFGALLCAALARLPAAP